MNKIVISILLLIAVVATIFFYRIFNSKKNDNNFVTQEGYHNLTKDEIAMLKSDVKKGNAEAAMRIASYYGYCLHDNDKDVMWIKKAAQLGSKNAKEVLPGMLDMMGKKLEDIPDPDLE